MGRGQKPAKSKEAKPPVARKSPKDEGTRVRDLDKQLAAARAQQAATAEILRVIGASPTNPQPVFDAIIASAVKLCEAYSGILVRIEDGLIHRVTGIGPHGEAHESVPPEVQGVRRTFPRPLDTRTALGQAILERRVVQLQDTQSPTAPPVLGRAGSSKAAVQDRLRTHNDCDRHRKGHRFP